jgi:sulfur-carrier protein
MAKLLFLGKFADMAGGREQQKVLSKNIASMGQLLAQLQQENPMLAEALQHVSTNYVVNQEICHADAPIKDTDEIAFLPPMSGG